MTAIEHIKTVRKLLEIEIVCPRKYGVCNHDNPHCPIFHIDQAIAKMEEKCKWEWVEEHKAWVTPHRKIGTVNLKCYTFKGDDCPTCSKPIEEVTK